MAEQKFKGLAQQVVQDMVHWLERAVIGLNLCPFAKAVHVKGQIHYAVSAARQPSKLLEELECELLALAGCTVDFRETTLLMAPFCLEDYLEFNDFLDDVEDLLARLGLAGEFQIASFHPEYRFAGVPDNDITNYTNRAPYPTLHLLREASIDRAVAAVPETETIYERNMELLQQMGHAGWAALDVTTSVPNAPAASDREGEA